MCWSYRNIFKIQFLLSSAFHFILLQSSCHFQLRKVVIIVQVIFSYFGLTQPRMYFWSLLLKLFLLMFRHAFLLQFFFSWISSLVFVYNSLLFPLNIISLPSLQMYFLPIISHDPLTCKLHVLAISQCSALIS